MSVRYFSSTAIDNTISAGVGSTDTTIPMTTALSGWPSQYPFTLVLDPGTSSEEVLQVTGAPAALLYPVTRGVDGSTGKTHLSGAVVSHRISARDVAEPNAHVNASANVHGLAVGDTVAGLAALSLKAADTAVVHNTGNETVAGVKTFTASPVVPSASFPESAVTNLVSDLSTLTTNVTSATSTANNANTTANTASTNASAAVTTANSAVTTANSAVASLSWSNISLAGGFSASGGFGTPQYAKDALGIVYLRGVITNAGSTANGTTLGTLPSGYRPSAVRRFAAYQSGAVLGLDIDTAGNLMTRTSANIAASAAFALDGIIFDVAS